MKNKRVPSQANGNEKILQQSLQRLEKLRLSGQSATYLNELRKLVHRFPLNRHLRHHLLNYLVQANMPDALIVEAQHALDFGGKDPSDWWHFKAIGFLMLNDVDQANEACVHIDPRSKAYQSSWLNRVRIALMQKDMLKAKRELEELAHLTTAQDAPMVMLLAETVGSDSVRVKAQTFQNTTGVSKQQISEMPLLLKQDRFLEAEAILKQLVEEQPEQVNFRSDLGYVYYRLHDYAKAEFHYKKVLEIAPDMVLAYQNLCAIYSLTGQNAEGERCALEGLKRAPDHTQLLHNLAIILANRRDFVEAEKYYLKVLQNDPKGAAYWMNYGNMLKDSDRPYEAEQAYHRSIAIDPKSAANWNNLGSALAMQGKQSEAMEAFRKAHALDPQYQTAINNILFTSTHCDTLNVQEIAQEHRHFGALLSAIRPKPEWSPKNQVDPNRRLRVGIISADFYHHVVTQIFSNIWEEFDRTQFEWHLFFNHHVEDHESREYARRADYWRNVVGMKDEDLRELIVAQEIDILIDLAGHTAGNRLQMMCLRAAPIQISWLGHPHTTGIPEIDYFMGDYELIPPGLNEVLFTEKLIRLPSSYSFQAFGGSAVVSPLPAMRNGFITLGSFNRPNKIGNRTLTLWAKVMAAIPNSRLKLGPINDTRLQERILVHFAGFGIDVSRIEFFGRMPYDQYMHKHGDIDFLLDTFPFTGCGTTINALWQGVPILTLAGQSPLQRQGAMFMRKLGLDEWVAENEESFVAQAIAVSMNIEQLAQVRSSMRDRFAQSDLMQARKTASYVEYALREVWRCWCSGSNKAHVDVPVATSTRPLAFENRPRFIDMFGKQDWNEISQIGLPLFAAGALSATDKGYLGLALFELQNYVDAARVLSAATTELDDAHLWNVLGVSYTRLGQHHAACEGYARASKLQPTDRGKKQNLINAYMDSGQLQKAKEQLSLLLQDTPNDRQWLKLIAAVSAKMFDWSTAKIAHERLLALATETEKENEVLNYVALLLNARDWQGAQQQLNQAVIRDSKSAKAWFHKGLFFHHGNRSNDAINCFKQAVGVEPDNPQFHETLAVEYSRTRESSLAIEHYQRALNLRPQNPETWRNYAWLLEATGRTKEAIEANYKALEIQALFPSVIDNLLFALTKCDHLSPDFVASEHRRIGALQEERSHVVSMQHGLRSATKGKLRVGFVSADFHEHVAMKLFAPVLDALMKEDLQIFIYSNDKNYDAMSERIRGASHAWRDITQTKDEDAAHLIKQDDIDVLFDLSGRTSGNRLGVFLYRPAPVQVSWLGNPYSTGLACIDYYFADQHLISHRGQEFFTEKLVSLRCGYAFEPAAEVSLKIAPPCLSNGYITFGSFNRLNKIGTHTIELWQSVLSAIPNAHMMIGPVQNEEIKQLVLSQFNSDLKERLHFVPWLNPQAYLDVYRDVDVVLDAVPFSGGGTSLNALWQGVPVITLTGDSPQQRQGEVYLQHLGLTDWIAHTPAEFTAKALDVASRPEQLVTLRKELRERFKSSLLSSPAAVAHGLFEAIKMVAR